MLYSGDGKIISGLRSDGELKTQHEGSGKVAVNPLTKSGIAYQRPMWTGDKTSKANYDAAWLYANTDYYKYVQPTNPLYMAELDNFNYAYNNSQAFRKLINLNEFGNYERFTDINGAANPNAGNGYIICHLTGLAVGTKTGSFNNYYSSTAGVGAGNFAHACLKSYEADHFGFQDWRLPTAKELFTFYTGGGWGQANSRGFFPWNFNQGGVWTSSVAPTTSFTYSHYIPANSQNANVVRALQTTSLDFFIIRNHYS